MTPEPLRALPDPDEVNDVLCRAARQYADLLGLRNHTVEVTDDPPHDPQALAECELAVGRAHVRLRFRIDFPEADPEEQRLALTHELLHPHLQRLTERVRQDFAAEVGGVAFRVFWRSFSGDVEALVDVLANLLAPTMPPIEWGTRI